MTETRAWAPDPRLRCVAWTRPSRPDDLPAWVTTLPVDEGTISFQDAWDRVLPTAQDAEYLVLQTKIRYQIVGIEGPVGQAGTAADVVRPARSGASTDRGNQDDA